MSEKKYYFPKTAYKGTFFTEWEKEYELPDSFPDIFRLIRADSNPRINSIFINQENTNSHNRVEIEGMNLFNILYHSNEDDKIHNAIFSDFFNVTEDIKQHFDNLIPTAKIFCVFISCKVISKRKIYIKARNKISLKVIENTPLTIPNIDSENNTLYFNTNSFTTQSFLEPTTFNFQLEESLTIDGTYPTVDNVIFSTVRIIPLDLVKGSGNATLNTTVIFKVFYESQNRYFLFSRSVPVSLQLDDPDIDENTLLYYYLTISDQSVSTQMDNYGEERILRFSYSPTVILFKIKESIEEMATDVFSSTNFLETKNEAAIYEELIGIIQRPFTIEKVFEVPDFDFKEIYDSSTVIDVESIESTEEGKQISGLCGISVLGQTEKGVESANFSVNFNQIFPEIKDDAIYDCSVFPIQTNASLSGRNMISVRVSANATIKQYKNNEYIILSSFSPTTEREQKDKNCLTLYYPSQNETLWDISKEYGIDPFVIAKENPQSFSKSGEFTNKTKNILIP